MDANVKNGHIVIHFIIPGKEKRATTLKVCRFNLMLKNWINPNH